MPIGVPVATEKYVRIQMRDPINFRKDSFRTHDIGREGYSKRIAGIDKKTGDWKTQSWLISRKEPKKRAKELLKDIEYQFKRSGIPFRTNQRQVLRKML